MSHKGQDTFTNYPDTGVIFYMFFSKSAPF